MTNLIKSKVAATVAVFFVGSSFWGLTNNGNQTTNRIGTEILTSTKKHQQTSIDLGEFTISGQNFEAWGDGSGNINAVDALDFHYNIIGPVSSFSGTYAANPFLNVTATIIYNSVEYDCKNLDTSF